MVLPLPPDLRPCICARHVLPRGLELTTTTIMHVRRPNSVARSDHSPPSTCQLSPATRPRPSQLAWPPMQPRWTDGSGRTAL
jgi:hypothetical protein